MPHICQVALTDLPLLCNLFAGHLVPNTVILLFGNLGAGKTTFMQFLGKSLGVKEQITSPTFTLIDEYYSGRLPLYHIDLYRLEPAHVSALHLELYWQGVEFEPGIVAIEWSERLLVLPPSFIAIKISHTNKEDERIITWETRDENVKLLITNFWQALPDRIKLAP